MPSLACTECPYVFTEAEIAAEDKKAWGHPCHGVKNEPEARCESFRSPVKEDAYGNPYQIRDEPDNETIRNEETEMTLPIPTNEESVAWAEEADRIAGVLREMSERLDGVDSGHCRVCGGFRLYDTKGNVQPCEAENCLSHRVAAILDAYEPPTAEVLGRIKQRCLDRIHRLTSL